MPTINMTPDFTSDEGVKGVEEVKEDSSDATVGVSEEKETPAEPPAVEDEKPPSTLPSEGTGEDKTLERAKLGLEAELIKLRKEISELRGSRRELKEQQLIRAESKLDELKDLNPEDVQLIDRVLRSKGLITKEEAHKMFYESVKQEELNKFLEKYPEYKPENDPGDKNWSTLLKEFKRYYRMPEDPHYISDALQKAHHGIVKVLPSSGRRDVTNRERVREIASLGAGGVSKSTSSGHTLDPTKRAMLERGGWSPEEIKRIEQKLDH